MLGPETCCGSEPCERRDARERRENASKGRVQARSRTWPALCTRSRRGVLPCVASPLGHSLIELLFVTAIIAIVSAVAVPGVLAAIDESRAVGAVRYLSTKLQRLRMEAVARSSNAGLRFISGAGGYSYAAYVDGNGNGVRAADIKGGVDRELMPLERLPDLFRGIDFGLVPGLPPVEPGEPPPGTDPIKTGASDILSFSAIGTSTSGSLYVRGASGAQYVIRVFGDTAKTRILRFDARAKRWSPL